MNVALTFDDGPNPNGLTPQFLDALSKYGVKATFFCIGQNVDANSDVVKRTLDEGHVVGNHTYTHPHLPTLDDNAVVDELGKTNTAIQNAIGQHPVYWRPPYGETDERVNGLAAQQELNGPILWTIDTRDWSGPGVDAIVASLMSAQDGSIILCHDGVQTSDQTLQAIDRAIPQLQQQGVNFVTIPELLGGGMEAMQLMRALSTIKIPHPATPILAKPRAGV